MVAAPQRATLTFSGVSGASYVKEIYISDVDKSQVTFDAGSGAGASSPTKWTAPEPMVLEDLSVASGLTDTTKIQLTATGQATGDLLRYANHLNSLNNRPKPMTFFDTGEEVGAVQLA